jgi:hypothetical protein
MSKTNQYTAQQFINAIPGSGGIISTIARRVDCNWSTAKKYIESFSTIKAAYDDEREAILDVAESVVYGNIQAAAKIQRSTDYNAQVDSSDAKWLLARKGKDRGYAEQNEVDIRGQIDVRQLSDEELQAIVEG